MNILKILLKNPKELTPEQWKQIEKFINEETLTQPEEAVKIKRTTRTVKKNTREGKLLVLNFRGRTLYPKTNLKVKK